MDIARRTSSSSVPFSLTDAPSDLGAWHRLRDLRNRLDFFLRSTFRWPGPSRPFLPDLDRRLAEEVGDFLLRFDWARALQGIAPDKGSLVVADIGAKNFYLAPVLDTLFRRRGIAPEVHGVEIDAYRRYRDLRTRASVGRAHAARIPNGHFHPVDFLAWQHPLHVALLLNPFVTLEPHLRWGLPLKAFQPHAMFTHAFRQLAAQRGLLVVSSPTEAECQRALVLAEASGFVRLETCRWQPGHQSLQRQARWGMLFAARAGSHLDAMALNRR